jgi:hypothetical protein
VPSTKTPTLIKQANRRLRGELGIKVHLVKTSTKKENIEDNFCIIVFHTKKKTYISYPREQKIADEVYKIFKEEVSTEFRVDWNRSINTAMALVPLSQ